MFSAFVIAAVQAPAMTLSGYWTNESRTVVVLVAPCAATAFCGTVQSASDKARADARRGGTANLIGTELLHEFVQVAPGRWKGTLFVPDLRKRTKAEIIQLESDRLRIRGCAVGQILCKSQLWIRSARPEVD
ncbi:MAG TPA: DUF2147 domain-containing protein [Terriglobales bacterium]|nr:DUF2147 domain-containing protein [Terriglobales bacterium]